MKQKLLTIAQKRGKRLINEQRYREIFAAAFGFFANLLYAIYNGILATLNHSLWFVAMCAYYIILGTMRFFAILCERKNNDMVSPKTKLFVMKFSGIMLMILSIVLMGVIYITQSQNIAAKHDEIIMITIATYTFWKITMAATKAVKQHHNSTPLLAVIHSIGYAEVAASLLTLQHSMLLSFKPMNTAKVQLLNAATDGAVCLFVLGLGMALLMKNERMSENGKI